MNDKQTSKEEREKLLDRIKKLLALSTSDNQAEAELAAQRAQELISKHMVDESELQRGNIQKIKHLFKKRRVEKWANYLINLIAFNNFCQCAYKGGGRAWDEDAQRMSKEEVLYTIIGRSLNITVVVSMFDYLYAVGERLAKEHIKGVPRSKRTIKRNSFLLGYVQGIRHKFNEQRKTWIDEDADFAQALVRVEREDERAVNDFKEKTGENWQTNLPSYEPTVDEEALVEGVTAGLNTSIERQVQGTQRQITGRVA